MRIIGGRLGGKTINPPAGYAARPTTDFAREGLFNVLGNEYEFEDLKVLDLFGGTGAVAFEFASRGAARVYSVEMSRENASFIKTEAARLGLDNVTMVRDNVFDFLPIISSLSMVMSIRSGTTAISKKRSGTVVSTSLSFPPNRAGSCR